MEKEGLFNLTRRPIIVEEIVKGKQNKTKNRRPSSSSVEEIRDHGIWFVTTNREIRSQVKALSKRQ